MQISLETQYDIVELVNLVRLALPIRDDRITTRMNRVLNGGGEVLNIGQLGDMVAAVNEGLIQCDLYIDGMDGEAEHLIDVTFITMVDCASTIRIGHSEGVYMKGAQHIKDFRFDDITFLRIDRESPYYIAALAYCIKNELDVDWTDDCDSKVMERELNWKGVTRGN